MHYSGASAHRRRRGARLLVAFCGRVCRRCVSTAVASCVARWRAGAPGRGSVRTSWLASGGGCATAASRRAISMDARRSRTARCYKSS
ncbi:hypothetical protein PR002_g7125 [Phytophthora rubi]|uniref:Uncharacterized protein n=1 Tax=Phytophthora rubi TaxID=129364 RepID=A0A6A3MTC2_9STRA|nr:hypothetical protein PR002_g7125 [Phytophthora rubi]